MAKILYFHLQGLCMSYGESARWANRETSEFPTLSGIVGMIANGFGYDRSDPRIAELSHNLSVGSRCDTKGTIITDFQTAHSDKFTQANGKENYSTTIVRRKGYLYGAKFTVALASEDQTLLDDILGVLTLPARPLTYGRKCCIPDPYIDPAITDEYSNLEEALQYLPLCPTVQKMEQKYEVEIPDQYGSIVRNDMVRGLLEYGSRNASRKMLEYKGPKPPCCDEEEPEEDIVEHGYYTLSSSEDIAEDGCSDIDINDMFDMQDCSIGTEKDTKTGENEKESLYLSKFSFDTSYPNVHYLLYDKGALHVAVQRLFQSARQTNNVLWNLHETQDEVCVYIRSSSIPVSQSRGLKEESLIEDKQEFCTGQVMEFRIACNPSRQSSGKRRGATTCEEAIEWLRKKSGTCGFELITTSCHKLYPQTVTRQGIRFSLMHAEISGVLKVTDPELFRSSYINGIGRELAYGNGMLICRPARQLCS